jgi:hypothetical protein
MRPQCFILNRMSKNPKESKWYSAPQSARRRRGKQFCLSDEARLALDSMAGPGAQSAFVESLILAAHKNHQRGH